MAKTFLTNINLKGNQLLNAVIHSASSAPSALAAGQLYFNTGDSTFYYSTGTGTGNWSPVGVQYISAVGSNLSVTDGELNISGTPSFTSLSVTGNNIGTNIAIGDDAYIGDLNVSNHIAIQGQQDVTKGGIVFGSAKTEKISSNGTDLTLTADNDIILLPGSNYAYIGTPQLDGNNRIATIGDISAGAIHSISGTTDQINVSMNGEAATISLADSVNINTGLTLGGAFSENNGVLDVRNGNDYSVFQVDSNGDINNQYHGYSNYNESGLKTGIININSFVNISSEGNPPAGYLFLNSNSGASGFPTLHLEANGDLALRAGANGNDGNIILYTGETSGPGTGKVYIGWNNAGGAGANAYNQVPTIGGTETFYNKTIGDKLNFTGYTNPTDGYIWSSTDTGNIEVFAEYGIQLSPSNNIVNIGSGYGEIHLQKTEYWRDGTQQGIIAAQSDGSLRLTGINSGLQLETNSGDLDLNSHNNNINLTADGQININNTHLYINNGRRLFVSGGQYIGGADYESDGFLNIQDYHGENLFNVNTDGNLDGGTATVTVKGAIKVYGPGASGNQVANIARDGDDNLVINATQNNLILQSDNNNSVYLGSVTADNKVVKFSDLAEVQSGLSWKQAVNLLWNDSNPPLSGATGTLVIDGHPALTNAQDGYRILITSAGADVDGIYTYHDDNTNWFIARSTDADTFAKLVGAAVFVEEGTQYGATSWVQSNHYLNDFTGQTWSQFSGQGTYTGSTSILLDGTSFSVILDSDSLEVTGSGLKVNYHTDGGLDNNSGLYVKTSNGVKIDNSGNVAADYTAIESQLVTDGFVKSTDISDVTRKYSVDITPVTPFSNTTFTITHNLGTSDVIARVYQTYGPDNGADVEVDIKRTSTNALTVSFAAAPASGETYTVVVIG